MARYPKKSKYKSVVIKKKRYYFYEILWEDITADGGHATAFDFMGFMPSRMITRAYVFEKDKKYVRTFASYEVNEKLVMTGNVDNMSSDEIKDRLRKMEPITTKAWSKPTRSKKWNTNQ